MLLGFGVTDEDIAETTDDIGIGILERRIPSCEVTFSPLSPLVVTTTEEVLVAVVEKLLVLVVCGCLEAKNSNQQMSDNKRYVNVLELIPKDFSHDI